MANTTPAVSQNLAMRSIPQEITGRGSVFAVCFCFLFSIAPHFVNLPIWVIIIVLVALVWRSLQNIGRIGELPKWMLIPLVLFGGIGVFAAITIAIGFATYLKNRLRASATTSGSSWTTTTNRPSRPPRSSA